MFRLSPTNMAGLSSYHLLSPSSPSLLLRLLLLLPLLLVSPTASEAQLLSFTLRTAGAAWSPRSESNIEWYPTR